jgi:hypothetical protein
MTWTTAETNRHQDHVIAHVVGATPLGYFIWDETAYILLDIGFIWNIYLDMEMGLLPHMVTIDELETDDTMKKNLRLDVDVLTQGGESLLLIKSASGVGPIQSAELFESEDGRRLVLDCEAGNLVIETNISHRVTRINTDQR